MHRHVIENGKAAFASVRIEPQVAALTANTNDLALTSCEVILSPDSNWNLTGLDCSGACQGGAVDGARIRLLNRSDTYSVTLKHNDSNSLAANRFNSPLAADLVLGPKEQVRLIYDSSFLWLDVLPAPASGSVLFFGAGSGISTSSATRYLFPGSSNGVGPSASRQSLVMPMAGLIDNMYYTATSGGASGTLDVTLMKNNSASALTIALNNTDTSGNDTTHSVTVAQGDVIDVAQISGTVSGSASNVYVTMRFRPL